MNQEFDPLDDIEAIPAMCSDVVYTGLSVMYTKKVECASAMTNNSLLMNNITKNEEAPLAGAMLG